MLGVLLLSIKKHGISLGLAAVCAIGIMGYKDTGIFVNKYTTKTNNGIEISYNRNNRANIVAEDDKYFRVVENGETLFVPKSHLLKVDNGANGYVVEKNTAIKDVASGNVLRVLFLDEKLQPVEEMGNVVKVKTEDNLVGTVDLSSLERLADRNITYGVSKVDRTLDNGVSRMDIKYGEAVKIAWFEKDYYIIYDANNNKYNVNVDDISLVELEETKPAIVQEEKDSFNNEVVAEKTSELEARALVIGEEPKAKEQVEVKAEEKIEVQYNAPANADLGKAAAVIADARENLGAKYVYADTGKAGFDCSGLIYAAYLDVMNMKLPRSSKDMVSAGVEVRREDLQPGDLIFFDTVGNGGISHVGMYTGNNMMIHASSSKGMVVEDSLVGDYYTNRYVTARRVLN